MGSCLDQDLDQPIWDAIEKKNIDGFKIAEEDLKLRGPGELLGLRQSGLPSLRIADLERDQALLIAAKKDVDSLIETFPSESILHIDRWHRNYKDMGRS